MGINGAANSHEYRIGTQLVPLLLEVRNRYFQNLCNWYLLALVLEEIIIDINIMADCKAIFNGQIDE